MPAPTIQRIKNLSSGREPGNIVVASETKKTSRLAYLTFLKINQKMNKKSLLFLSLFLINFGAFSETNRDFDQFLKILSKLESSDNPRAHNKKENAIGIYQIRLLYFKDAQKFDKSLEKYTHSDCFDPEIARKVVKSYLSRYCKNGSFEDMARCHNSGPNWKNKKEKTEKYIRKFRLHKK